MRVIENCPLCGGKLVMTTKEIEHFSFLPAIQKYEYVCLSCDAKISIIKDDGYV